MTDCIVCQENSGEVEVSSGILHSDDQTTVFQVPPVRSS